MGEKDEGYQHLEGLYFTERSKNNYAIKVLNEIFEDLDNDEEQTAKWRVVELIEYLDD
jgi:hypothetical protein